MDFLLSVVASDVAGRLFSFLIGKYQERGAINTADRLQRALLRARIVVEEAEGRQIANRAMLQELHQLRREMFRATYAIDTFRWRATQLSKSRRLDATVSRSRSHIGTSPPSIDCRDLLPVMVESLEAVLKDMTEFVVLLGGCPRVTQQPYTTYLFMENCMFGRQMEKEHVISFLSQPARDLDVLPIIGPHDIGKRTLVEHVCLDDRVRDCFAKIHHLSSFHLDDFHNNEHHHQSLVDFTGRSLIVIHVDDQDTDAEESWRRFHSAVRRRVLEGSKVIVISRKEAHSSMGTTPPFRLRAPCREDLWYFFRALAFGAADPDERPELARLAMTLCARISNQRGCTLFATANMIAASLRAELSTRSWLRVLKVFSAATVLQLGATEDGLDYEKAGHYSLFRPVKDAPAVPCLFFNGRKFTSVTQRELPEVTMLGLLSGSSLPPAGETLFDVLVWTSRIPPYASYVVTCDIDKAHHQQLVAPKTRLLNKRRRDHQEDYQCYGPEEANQWLFAYQVR